MEVIWEETLLAVVADLVTCFISMLGMNHRVQSLRKFLLEGSGEVMSLNNKVNKKRP